MEEGLAPAVGRPGPERRHPAGGGAGTGPDGLPLRRLLGPRGLIRGPGGHLRGVAGQPRRQAAGDREGLRADHRSADGVRRRHRRPPRRGRCPGARRAADRRRLQRLLGGVAGLEAVAPPAVHDVHAAAGGRPQAPLRRRAHDAPGPEALRGRLHHLHADGLRLALRAGRRRRPGRDHRALRRRPPARQAPPVLPQGQERPGGPRGHPPGRRPVPPPGGGRPGGRRRRRPPLRPRLEALRRLPDGRRPGPAGIAPAGGRLQRRRGRRLRRLRPHDHLRRLPAGLCRGLRRPRRRAGGPGDAAAGARAG